MEAAFKESKSKVGRILDITERVNDKLQQEMDEVKRTMGKMNEKLEKAMEKMEKKIDALLAIQAPKPPSPKKMNKALQELQGKGLITQAGYEIIRRQVC